MTHCSLIIGWFRVGWARDIVGFHAHQGREPCKPLPEAPSLQDDARRMGGPIDATVPSVALWTGSPGRRCDAPQCEALALLINAADGGANALRRQPSRGHDQLSFDDRLADVLD